MLYAWWNDATQDILYKHVNSGLHLRMAGNTENTFTTVWLTDLINQGIQLPPDADNKNLHITLTDTKGTVCLNTTGNIDTANGAISQLSNSLASGLYMFSLQTNNNVVYRCKIIKP